MQRIENMSLWERVYFPEIARSLRVTGYRFWRNLAIHTLHAFGLVKNRQAAVTIQYQNREARIPIGFAGATVTAADEYVSRYRKV